MLVHAGVVLGLAWLPMPQRRAVAQGYLELRLTAPPEPGLPAEGGPAIYEAIPIEEIQPPPEVPEPEAPPPPPEEPKISDEELAAEREALTAQLAAARRELEIAAAEIEQEAARNAAQSPIRYGANLGTVRSLDLSGYPDAVVNAIMERYRLRIYTANDEGGTNQSFLSSTTAGGGDRYYAGRSGRGVKRVFEVSRKAVAHLSRLEEEEIHRRGLDLMRAHVSEVRYGIVQTAPGQYDLGLTFFRVDPIE